MGSIMRSAGALTLALALHLGVAGVATATTPEFRPYANGLVERLALGVDRFAEAVDSGDVEAAREAWVAARYGWERGETFYGEFFPKSDVAIDIWPDADQGFHAIEAALFKSGDLDKIKPMVEDLQAAVTDLEEKVSNTALTQQGLLDGTTGIVFEIGAEKAGGGESPFSGTSLTDMQNNMIGVETAYALAFAAKLQEKAPELHNRILSDMVALTAALDVDKLEDLKRTEVMRLSEQLAGSLQQAAKPLGLESPTIGG